MEMLWESCSIQTMSYMLLCILQRLPSMLSTSAAPAVPSGQQSLDTLAYIFLMVVISDVHHPTNPECCKRGGEIEELHGRSVAAKLKHLHIIILSGSMVEAWRRD